MYYDLNVPWSANPNDLQARLSFLAELGYNVVAISHMLRPATTDLTNPIPTPLPFPPPPGIRRVLTRCTVPLASGSAASKNPRLSDLRPHYDILAVRPADERALQLACADLDPDIISLDLARRYPFPFRHSIIGLAVRRGIALELCYSGATSGGEAGATGTQGASQVGASQAAANETEVRRNAFTNAQALLRASRGGRGVIISSGARSALGIRAPGDAINLAVVWGMKPDAAADAVGETVRKTLAATRKRCKSYRGVVEVVYGGEKPEPVSKKLAVHGTQGKRKALAGEDDAESPAAKKNKRGKRPKKDGPLASGAEQPAQGGAFDTATPAID